MTPWSNEIPGKHPLKLTSKVRVQYRDGSISQHLSTVRDHHGIGDESSNWFSAGEPEDIVAYEEIAA
jgi:hypothetical protein